MGDYSARKSEMTAFLESPPLDTNLRQYLGVVVELYAHGRDAQVLGLCRALARAALAWSAAGSFLGVVAWRLVLPGPGEIPARQALLDTIALARAASGQAEGVDQILLFVDLTPEKSG